MSRDGKEIVRILVEDYGIHSEDQLNQVLRKIGGFDISIFCKMKDEGGKTHDTNSD